MNKAPPRFAPQQKLVLHPQFSAYLRGEAVYPVNVEISPCGVCNASCDFCFYANTGELGEHRKVFLDRGVAIRVIDECRYLGTRSITWTGGGEPTLAPRFDSLVEHANLMGLEQGLFTNALAEPRYDPALLSWIRITMTDKPYKQECIEALRPCPILGFAFNYAGPQDDDYLRETLALAEAVMADYVQVRPALAFHGQTVDIAPPAFTHPLMHVTDYKFEEAKRKHPYKNCEGYHFTPFIWEDGNVDVCAYMRKHQGYTLGNVYQNTLKEILDRAPPSVPVHEQCQVCCKLHEINLLIDESRQLEDRNFP